MVNASCECKDDSKAVNLYLRRFESMDEEKIRISAYQCLNCGVWIAGKEIKKEGVE